MGGFKILFKKSKLLLFFVRNFRFYLFVMLNIIFIKSIFLSKNKKIAVGVASGVFIKSMALVFTLITVPMTLKYLGAERYGIWVTMISMLAWISVVDMGVANGLTPLLTSAFGKNRLDLAQGYVSTAFWSLTISSIFTGFIFYFFWGFVDWGNIFNIKSHDLESQVSSAMALAIGIFLLNLPISIVQRIYLADQKGVTANKWQFVSSFAGVVGIYFATKTQGSLVYLVFCYSGAQLLVGVVNLIWLFGWAKPELRPFVRPNFLDAKTVMAMGGLFFLNQLATLVVFQKDNILITHYFGPIHAANYSILWQIFFYFNTINLLIAPYLGPAFGDAYAKKDSNWMRVAASRYLKITFFIAFFGVVLLSLFYEQVLDVWVGKNFKPSLSTVLWMGLWTMVLSVQWPIISLINSTGQIKIVTLFYVFAAVVNVFLSVIFMKLFGVFGGLMASVLTMIFIVLIPSAKKLVDIINSR